MRLFTVYIDNRTGKKYYPKAAGKMARQFYEGVTIEKGIVNQFGHKLKDWILGAQWYDIQTGQKITDKNAQERWYWNCSLRYNWLGRFIYWYYADKVRNWNL